MRGFACVGSGLLRVSCCAGLWGRIVRGRVSGGRFSRSADRPAASGIPRIGLSDISENSAIASSKRPPSKASAPTRPGPAPSRRLSAPRTAPASPCGRRRASPEVQPLPDLGAGNLGGRGVLHEIVERHGAAAAQPGLDILHADADVLAQALFGALALVDLEQFASRVTSTSSRLTRELVRAAASAGRTPPSRPARDRDGRPRCRHGRRGLRAPCRRAPWRRPPRSRAVVLDGICAAMPPIAKAPRRWQVLISSAE